MSEVPASEILLVYVTIGSREAGLELGRVVVKERLAACANLLPEVTSIYEWEGELAEEGECVLFLKVPKEREAVLRERIVALHPYDVPAIVSWPLHEGHPPFLKWVVEQTGPRGG